MRFDDIIQKIEQNSHNHVEGYYNCIPFLGMERLERVLPGIEQATYYCLAASSGVGKSTLARHMFIHTPLMYAEQNPDSGVEVSILYFSLEESKEKIILSEIRKYLYTKYGEIIDIKQLQSVGRHNVLTVDQLAKVKEAREHVETFLNKVKIYDTIKNPTGIFKAVRDYALTVGKYYTKEGIALTLAQHEDVKASRGETYKLISHYKKNNDRHYVIILIDHISLLHPESQDGKMQTLHQAMSKMSSDYNLTFRDKFGFTPVVVQQLSSAKETIESNHQGKTLEEKLEPSLDALGDNKLLGRDYSVVLGLFDPQRYGIANHNKYDLTKLKNSYRSLSIIKSREGLSNLKLPLCFNGKVGEFKELPKSDDIVTLERVYEYVQRINT